MLAIIDSVLTTSPYFVGALISAVLCALFIYVRRFLRHKEPADWHASPVQVINSRDRMFYKLLRETFPGLQVLIKVSVADIVKLDPTKISQFWADKANSLSVTFLLCTSEGRPYIAIDLSPHRSSSDSLKTSALKRKVLDSALVRLIELPDEPVVTPDILRLLAQDDHFEHGATTGDVSRILNSRSHRSDFSSTSQAFNSTRDHLSRTVESNRQLQHEKDAKEARARRH